MFGIYMQVAHLFHQQVGAARRRLVMLCTGTLHDKLKILTIAYKFVVIGCFLFYSDLKTPNLSSS